MQNKELSNPAEAFKKLYDVVARLRGPGGCAWDQEQTPLSLRADLIEETYECIEAIDQGDAAHIKEELGDIFLLAAMISYMHEEDGIFSVAEALEGVSDKLIRRHPHVFEKSQEGEQMKTAEILQNWARIKVEQEGRKPKDSLLDEVARGLPPLDRAYNLQKKAAKVGFDWPNVSGVIDKIMEELEEVKEAMAEANEGGTASNRAFANSARAASDVAEANSAGANSGAAGNNRALEAELGDLLFSVINICRFCGIEASVALQGTNAKFTERFKHVEKRMKENGQEMKAENLDTMESYWNEAKG